MSADPLVGGALGYLSNGPELGWFKSFLTLELYVYLQSSAYIKLTSVERVPISSLLSRFTSALERYVLLQKYPAPQLKLPR